MPAERNCMRRRPRKVLRATFSGLRVDMMGQQRVLKCECEIELRPLSLRSELYGIFSTATHGRMSANGHCLRDAKACVEGMFEQQVTPWEELEPCFAR